MKASNILLDTDMNPKIGDFGLARLFGQDQTRDVTNRIVGTFGYMSPEYVMRGQYSTKSDVFSFGVLIIEIVTGQRNNRPYLFEQNEDIISTVSIPASSYSTMWYYLRLQVWRRWSDGTVAKMIDHSLGKNYPEAEVLKCINIGLLCLQENPVSKTFLQSYVNSLEQVKNNPQADLVTGKQALYHEERKIQKPKQNPLNNNCRWVKLKQGWMKLNVDGSIDINSEKWGIGVVLRNSMGMCSSPLEAELLACREGISLALQWTLLPFIVETDCLVVKNLIESAVQGRSELTFIVRGIGELLSGNREVIIVKIQRNQNNVSHTLANRARCESLTEFCPDDKCNFIAHFVCEDSLAE
ncbi:Os07g0540500 [Oryza sativa Japonica Group]|uniref:Os07g0540500 protein n=1 Tax=Oryza sativa subsp. japonica TaxID=39947 RepID=Q0D5R8_ORYSJ|nr:Os07g0540500 [Oryza sativa Japonica Group]|eukprot:NP_001059891.2 Os07g0540500 [Oryza sativa Japonica Group]